MKENIKRAIFRYSSPPSIKAFSSVAGKKESQGPIGEYFDECCEDSYFGEETWEKAESRLQKTAVQIALKKAGLDASSIDILFAGDLINQCTGSTYGLRDFNIPFLGIYGACSTMAQGLLFSSICVNGGYAGYSLNVTSSHFSTAERQFRFPLSYGGQRTPSSQWTCTASGAVILSDEKHAPFIIGGAAGKITDFEIKDANNMGAAMAPAAADTIKRYLDSTKTAPEDYDFIITGDLGTVGSKLLYDLLGAEGTDIRKVHKDCGVMIFDGYRQDTHAGGSGCGCSASVLCGYFLPMLLRKEINNILFAATGALMSPMLVQQGESIPCISHLVHISNDRDFLLKREV
ncbi:MAG: stage V sporulation protein AD [Oscillospiraceae bacterium]|nr:stage V sporulation protein AD [Oscillospiraceae bacterium]